MKLMFVGDGNVGKTSLLKSFQKKKEVRRQYVPISSSEAVEYISKIDAIS
jgi:GTPase SAR1 family protein